MRKIMLRHAVIAEFRYIIVYFVTITTTMNRLLRSKNTWTSHIDQYATCVVMYSLSKK